MLRVGGRDYYGQFCVEGEMNEISECSVRLFHDDGVMVDSARVMRLVLVLRVMVVALPAELVLLGYTVMMNDILQLCQCTE